MKSKFLEPGLDPDKSTMTFRLNLSDMRSHEQCSFTIKAILETAIKLPDNYSRITVVKGTLSDLLPDSAGRRVIDLDGDSEIHHGITGSNLKSLFE